MAEHDGEVRASEGADRAAGRAAPRRRKVRYGRPRSPGEMPGYLISLLFSATYGCSTAVVSAGIFVVVVTISFWILLRVAH